MSMYVRPIHFFRRFFFENGCFRRLARRRPYFEFLEQRCLLTSTPTLTNFSESLYENTPFTFPEADFATNYADADLNPLQTVMITSLPAHGTLQLDSVAVTLDEEIPDGQLDTLVYDPATNYLGADSFTWNASNGVFYAAASATVSLTVNDNPPTVSPVALSIAHNATYTFTAAAVTSAFSDVDPGNSLQAIEFTGLPTYGTLKFSGVAITAYQQIPVSKIGQLTYVAGTNFAGADTFDFSASDGTYFANASAAFTFNVAGTAPSVSTFSKATLQNTALTFDPTDFVYAFSEPNLGPNITSIQITSLPTHGTLTLLGSPVTVGQVITADDTNTLTEKIQALEYTPNSGFMGLDTIGWNATDGLHYAATAATIKVTVVSATALTVSGNGNTIAAGDTTTSANDYTDFRSMSLSTTYDGQTDTRTYTLTNNSASTVNLTGGASLVKITGSNPGDFTVTTQPGVSSLAAGGSTTFVITFAPKSAGSRSATVSIANSAGAAFTFALHGTGVATSNSSNGLQVATTTAGTGTGAPLGSVLTMQYTGFLLDGTRFDSSLNLDRTPFQFTIGLGQVISGWDNGLGGIKVGETRLLIIPAELAYGSSGQGNVPPNATLIFEVQCLAIGVARVGVLAQGATTLVTPGATTGNSTDHSNLGSLDFSTPSVSQVFSVYGVGYATSDGSYNAVWYYPTTTQVTLSGASAADFTLTHTTASTYSVVDGDSFTVQFNRPAVAGTYSAIISVFTNDAVHPTLTFTVQGTASPFVDFTASYASNLSLPTGTIVSGSRTNITLPVVIKNIGNAAPTGTTATDIQIFAHDTTSGTNTLITTFANESFSGLGYNQSHQFNLTFALPVGFAAGTYTLVAEVNNSGAIIESNSTNDFVTTTPTITVTQGLADLTGTLTSSTLLPSIVDSNAINSSLTVKVQNLGNVLLPTNQQISIQVIAFDTDNSSSVAFAPTTYSVANLAAGGSTSFTVPFKNTTGLPAGHYILEAQITPIPAVAEVNTGNDLVTLTAGAQNIAVLSADPFIDLTDAIGATSFPVSAILSGSRTNLTLPVTIKNAGNIAIPSGTHTTDVQIFAHDTTSSVETLITTITNVNLSGLASNATKTSSYTFALPVGFASGTYTLVAKVNDSGAITESNTSNNSAASVQTITVNQGLADLTGSLTSTTLLSSIVDTNAINSSLVVKVQNLGNVLLPANQQISIQVIAYDTDDDSSVAFAPTTYSVANLAAGGSTSFTVPFKNSTGLPAGHYILEAQITPIQALAQVSTANDLITQTAGAQNIAIFSADPFVDLTAAIGTTNFPASTISGNGTVFTLPVTIKNAGNIAIASSAPNITVQIFAHDTNTDEDTLISTISNVNVAGLAGNASKQFNFNASLPAGMATDPYTLVAVVNTTASITESDATNNSAASAKSINVTTGYYDLTGTLGSTSFPTSLVAGTQVSGKSLTVTVQNAGNIALPAVQHIQIQVNLHNSLNDDNTPLNIPTNLSVANLGANHTVNFNISLSSITAATGIYILTATITPVEALNEGNTLNNLITVNGSGFNILVTVTA